MENLTDRLALIVGDIALSSAEDELSGQWSARLDRQPRAFRAISAIWRILQKAAFERGAEMILVDVGPNLGALNRAALVAADYVAVPLAADLYSLQGLRNLGSTLKRWREEWEERRRETHRRTNTGDRHLISAPLPRQPKPALGYYVALYLGRPGGYGGGCGH